MSVIKKERWFLVGLFLFSLIVRAFVFQFYLSKNKNYWQVDSNTYNLVALGITKGKGISLPDGKPNVYRVPGYSLFLSIYYKIFGADTKNVLWFQIILASCIPLLIFFLSLVLFSKNILLAKIASFYSSIHIGLVLYSGFFMTETLFLFFFLLFCIFFLSNLHVFFCKKRAFQQNKVYINLLLAGFFLGITSLIRPVGHYLIVLSIILLLFSLDKTKQKLQKSLCLFFAWLIPVSFWLVRNYLLLGYVFFHTLPGGHFLYLSAARVAMHVHKTSYQDARQILNKKVHKLINKQEEQKRRQLNEIEKCYVHEKLAVQYFKMRPLVTLKNWLTDMLRTSLSLYSAELVYLESGRKQVDFFKKGRSIWSMFQRYLFPQTNSRLLQAFVYGEIIAFLFILLGFLFAFITASVLFFRSKQTELLCAFGKVIPFMSLFIVISLSGGYARMRLPIEPFLIILASHFWAIFFVNREL